MSIAQSLATSEEPPGEVVLSFGAFDLRLLSRLLSKGEQPIQLGGRAFDILAILVERAGALVSYEDLLAQVWPTTRVDESNLRVQIAALRKVLAYHGDGQAFITNVANQGYVFDAPVTRRRALGAGAPQGRRGSGNLPLSINKVFGRADVISVVRDRLETDRLVTLVGPGGIGKTTTAIEAAQGAGGDFVWFVDLASLEDPTLIAATIAGLIGLGAKSSAALCKVSAYLQPKQGLMVLDNCEHVIEHAAQVATTLLEAAPALRILATSREPLRVAGEWVCRLNPLKLPPVQSLSDQEPLDSPAVQLFVERAWAHAGSIDLGPVDAALVVRVCRRLDGIPLALELAAGAVGSLGLAKLARLIDQHFDDFGAVGRTADPRQQTLRATLDWSYNLLTPDQQSLLARLGVFSATFTLDSVIAVCADGRQSQVDAVRTTAELADKSLVVVDARGDVVLYRLLETTKAYARDKLAASGELEAVTARFARHVAAVFYRARATWSSATARAWAEGLRRWIGDVRQALSWAKGPSGDIDMGAALLIASAQLWLDLGYLREFLDQALEIRRAERLAPHLRMRLSAVVGHSIYELDAPPALTGQMRGAFRSALRLAVDLGDKQAEFDILISCCQECAATGSYDEIEGLANQVLSVGHALGRPDTDFYYDRLMAFSNQLLGRLGVAEAYVEKVYKNGRIAHDLIEDTGFVFHPLLFNQCVDARLKWMRGSPDQALGLAERVIEGVMARGHMPTYTYALRTVIPVGIWVGDEAFIEGPLETYLKYGEDRNLDYQNRWRSYIHWGTASRREGWSVKAARAAIEACGPLNTYAQEMVSTLHPGLMTADIIERVRRGRCGWCAAEATRAFGLLLEDEGDFIGAEAAFRAAYALARAQGALAWELRAAVSLSAALARRDQKTAGRDLLASVLARYTEGGTSVDVRQAAGMLATLSK